MLFVDDEPKSRKYFQRLYGGNFRIIEAADGVAWEDVASDGGERLAGCVNGAAAGVGCSLALLGDLIVAGESAYFLQAFVNIGLVPDGGSTWLLTRAIGRARATRMMMLGEKISGEQAEEWGLVYKCVEDADLMTEARALAEKLANGPTVAYATMKRNIATAMDQNLQMVLLAEAEGQRIAGATKDAMEGGMAFLQKRKAEFKGE